VREELETLNNVTPSKTAIAMEAMETIHAVVLDLDRRDLLSSSQELPLFLQPNYAHTHRHHHPHASPSSAISTA
jgi:hypothetical protein